MNFKPPGEPPSVLATAIPNSSSTSSTSIVEAALGWFEFGFKIIPIAPGTKKTAVKWDPWLAALSPETIVAHWTAHPDHELGLIVSDQFIVLDADSAASTAALIDIEKAFGVTPSMVVRTAKGVHHYYRRETGTLARIDSHSTTDHPERIDVKTGRALVVAPPSTGKVLVRCDVANAAALTAVGQAFIDKVFQHNGRPLPGLSVSTLIETQEPSEAQEPSESHLRLLETILRYLNPDFGYDDWLHVGMALHHETRGSDSGLALFDAWSGAGEQYRGRKETKQKWGSFQSGRKKTFKIGTLFWLAEQAGYGRDMILAEAEPFEMVEDEHGKV